ncbi:hypothetical protein [Microtetraspora glauca]|uniref:hypothetical protein n=1 Tax=Microtetraspora glauca TaxID=1996 RepID=UPI003F4CAE99
MVPHGTGRVVEDERHHVLVLDVEGRPDGMARGRAEAEAGIVLGVAEREHEVSDQRIMEVRAHRVPSVMLVKPSRRSAPIA